MLDEYQNYKCQIELFLSRKLKDIKDKFVSLGRNDLVKAVEKWQKEQIDEAVEQFRFELNRFVTISDEEYKYLNYIQQLNHLLWFT